MLYSPSALQSFKRKKKKETPQIITEKCLNLLNFTDFAVPLPQPLSEGLLVDPENYHQGRKESNAASQPRRCLAWAVDGPNSARPESFAAHLPLWHLCRQVGSGGSVSCPPQASFPTALALPLPQPMSNSHPGRTRGFGPRDRCVPSHLRPPSSRALSWPCLAGQFLCWTQVGWTRR